MGRPAVRISNEPTTLSDAIAKANSLYNLGLPLLKDLPPGTALYQMWQIGVTIQQPGPNGELMLIKAVSDFSLFGGLSAGVTLAVVQGDAKQRRRAVGARFEFQSLPAKPRARASRSRRRP